MTLSYAEHPGAFTVLQFTNNRLTKGRMDPIISPGRTSSHVHTIMGGSGFSLDSTGDDLRRSRCTNARSKADMSNYWFPSLYFINEEDLLESIEVYYVTVYYL